jgi:hypothetical protein
MEKGQRKDLDYSCFFQGHTLSRLHLLNVPSLPTTAKLVATPLTHGLLGEISDPNYNIYHKDFSVIGEQNCDF